MIRHGVASILGFVLLAGTASRAGELDSEFGPKLPTTPAAVAPERPDLATRPVGDPDSPPSPRASELDREAPAQAYFCRGFGFGRGFGGFGYGRGFGGLGYGGFGGFRSFGIGLGYGGFGGYGLGYGGYGSGLGGFGYPGFGGLGYGGYGYGGYGYGGFGYGGYGYPGFSYGGFALNIGLGRCFW